MRGLLIVIVIFSGIYIPQSALSQTIKIVWNQEKPRRNVDLRYVATLYKSSGNVASFLANPFNGTKFEGHGIVFEKDTLFAVFPKISEDGKPGNRLALSEDGFWIFLKINAVEQVSPASETFRKAVPKFDNLKRFLPLKNNGKYLTNTRACNSAKTQKRSSGNELQGGLEWGIIAATYGNTDAKEDTDSYPRGVDVTYQAYGIEGTKQYLEIIKEQKCGSSPDKGKHHYDLRINGQSLVSLNLAENNNANLIIDKYSGRAKIKCRDHRDAYHQFLLEEFEIPDQWLQIISSTTARWARGFVAFEKC